MGFFLRGGADLMIVAIALFKLGCHPAIGKFFG